ncbi:hypothetical protein VIGAN_05277100, partial [Vigna angularis var. angularis]
MSTSKQNIAILYGWTDVNIRGRISTSIDIRLSFNGGPCPSTDVDIRLIYIRLNIIEGKKRNWEVQEVTCG